MNELAKFEVRTWSAILDGLFYVQALEIAASPPALYGHFYTTHRIWFLCRPAPYLVQSHNCRLNYGLGHLVQVEVCTTCRCRVLCVPLTSVTRWHSNSRGAHPSPFLPIIHREQRPKRNWVIQIDVGWRTGLSPFPALVKKYSLA